MVQRPRQDGFDFGGEPETVERLFIGLMLPPVPAAAATDVLKRSRADHDLQGEAIRPDRLHVTLIHVGDYAGRLPGDVVAGVLRALDGLSETGFEVEFDRVGSFSGAPGKHPHVLLGDDGVEALKACRQRVWAAVRGQGRTLSRQEFTPHVTLAYGDQRLADRPIDPIRWRAEEIVLIHSEVGRSTYHTLGRWPLA